MKIIITILVVLAVLALASLGFIYSGVYNVAADVPHTKLVFWALGTTMDRSVEARSRSITVPAGFDSLDVSPGTSAYNKTCINCHGGPGGEALALAGGMNPSPPDLRENAEDLTAQSIYWIARHGIKMTGMPSFGKIFSEAELWSITAYIKKFPQMGEK